MAQALVDAKIKRATAKAAPQTLASCEVLSESSILVVVAQSIDNGSRCLACAKIIRGHQVVLNVILHGGIERGRVLFVTCGTEF